MSCEHEKECINPPDCFTGPTKLRFVYLDENDQNMLKPDYPNQIEVKSVKSKIGAPINFEVTSKTGGTIETGNWRLELTQSQFSIRPDCEDEGLLGCLLCINVECELYVSYYNRTEIDTLNVLYERVTEYDENNCPCTYFPLRYINYDGKNIMSQSLAEYGGGYIIRK